MTPTRIATSDGQISIIRAGDYVWAPPGEMHWHGAQPDVFLEHLVFSIGTVEWPDPRLVTDEQYAQGFEDVGLAPEDKSNS